MKPGQLASRRRASGFTLVEIMIVVCIMGVLMNIAAPQMLIARSRAQTKTCVANLHNINSAKEQWAIQTNASATATPSPSTDLLPYMRVSVFPVCPTTAAAYPVTNMSTLPTCSTQDPVTHQYIHVF